MAEITILGAGVMGSAMCLPAADRGHAVNLVGTHLDIDIIDNVRKFGRHPKLNVALPAAIKAFHYRELSEAIGEATDLIILGVSSAGVDWAIDQLASRLTRPIPIVMITKGMHTDGEALSALPDYVQARLKHLTGLDLDVAAIGGPCIAGELAVRRQTGTVITSRNAGFAERLCTLLETDYYHPRSSPDVMGVEICAAFKNFFAIAVGWAATSSEMLPPADNRALNHNAAAIIFDQAIAELAMLTTAHGGASTSVWGMPGAGDLYVTCQAGRNSRLGNNLGRGMTYKQVKDGPMKGDTIEGAELGVTVAKTLHAMMAKGALDGRSLPVTKALLATLTENRPMSLHWADLHRY
jgi:glycerol-3-phosphate dehydrogenase (NAD(P)+)